jgi:aminoglycoside phosphotransferase (APT) family kinase protein
VIRQEWAPELVVDEQLARRVVGAQFPDLRLSTLELLGEGWDMTVWLVDGEWTFRFPRREFALAGIGREIALLPGLAQRLPLPIPVPTLIGRPSEEFRWPFYGAPFLPGKEVADAELDDRERSRLARPFAEFLGALHSLDVDAELPVDPVRRADMTFRVPKGREFVAKVVEDGLWEPPPIVEEIFAAGLELPPPVPAAVCHGDLHLRHLLVHEDGGAAAVIDWIDLSRNDPAVDVVLYWSVFPPDGRAEFLDAYGGLTDEQLLRSRVLSLFLCSVLALYGHHEGLPRLRDEAVAALDRTVSPS